MERNVWVITHSDQDGMCSAAVVKDRYPHALVMITNYGRTRNLYKMRPGDLVFVTDFTLTLDEFQRLKQKGCEIIWIDHHKANYDEVHNQGWHCEGICRDDYCGAALTWMYLHPNMPPEAMPECVKLTNDYDLWKFEDPRTLSFSYGSGLWDIRPGNPAGDAFWRDLLSNDDRRFKLVLKYGDHIRRYAEMMQDTICNDLAYYTTIPTPMGPKNLLALTVRAGNSSVFDRMDKSKVDAVFTGQYVANIGHYRCSMYSPDNIKEILPIVQMFGGGGHPKAAGFQTNNFPIPQPEVKEPRDLETVIGEYDKLVQAKNASAIVHQWVNRGCNITMKAQTFHAEIGGYPCLAVNHQYLPDLMEVRTLASDCIDPNTQLAARFILGYVLSNTGWFRCCAYPTDTSMTLEELTKIIKANYPDSATRFFVSADGGVWWYNRDIPVHPPIIEQPLPQQARM